MTTPPHRLIRLRRSHFKPLGYTVIDRFFSKPGSDMFKRWNAAEARAFMPQARAILRKHGFERGPGLAQDAGGHALEVAVKRTVLFL